MSARNSTATEGRAGSLHLVGGMLCLDFANTTSGRGSTRPLDHLRCYGDLVAWAEHAGLVGAADADRLRADAEADPRAAGAVLAQAIELREGVHAVFRAIAGGGEPPEPAVAALNAALARALAHLRVSRRGGAYALGWVVDGPALDRMLWPIARSAAELLSEGPLQRVRQCPGPVCGWLFLDATKNGRRRWCDMKVCGSRDKARRYHRRKAASA
ncbi:MAG: ABATE domain-containing protein [Dongiaceae bacterium]